MRQRITSQAQFREAERGASLVTTLLLLLSLSVLGIAAMTASKTGTQIVSNDNLQKQLLVAAEAGLEAGRGQMMLVPLAAGWDTLLINPAPALVPVPVPGMASVHRRYRFIDDNDGDGDLTSDSNGMILVQAIGYIDDNPAGDPPYDAQVILEAGYFRAQAAASYAQENVDAGNTNATAAAQNVDTTVQGNF